MEARLLLLLLLIAVCSSPFRVGRTGSSRGQGHGGGCVAIHLACQCLRETREEGMNSRDAGQECSVWELHSKVVSIPKSTRVSGFELLSREGCCADECA
eukprot:1149076-Pelagomonas_calceolata.AAC.3